MRCMSSSFSSSGWFRRESDRSGPCRTLGRSRGFSSCRASAPGAIGGEDDDHFRSRAGPAVEADRGAVRVDDPLHQGQTEAAAAGLAGHFIAGAVELVEDAFLLGGIDPDSL